MNTKTVFLSIVVLTVLILIFIIVKNKQIRIALGILGICMTIGAILYFCNPTFRKNIDINLNPIEQHRIILDNQVLYLPLPPKTTLEFRTSDTQGTYLTKITIDEIYEYYSSIVGDKQIQISENGQEKQFQFQFNNKNIKLVVSEISDKRKIVVDAN